MDNNLLFQCQVLDVDDPLMLGRIRGRRLIDNYNDIIKSITNPDWNEEKDIWTNRDPFIFQPLLPYYVYQVPKVNEMVLVMYANTDTKFINQYYVQSTFYSPTATGFQYYQGGNKFMGTGIQILNPKPLKNQNGTYTDREKHKGVFPQPGDNSILGRGSADLIVKENDVLIRAGKFKNDTLQPNILPTANQQRGFLQISKFPSTKESLPDKRVTEFIETVVPINYLVEYVIINPENTLDKFTGSIYLYQITSNSTVNSKNISVNSIIPESIKKIVYTENFTALSKDETISFINAFIKNCNNKNTAENGTQLFYDVNNKFPIYYRPSNQTYSQMMDANSLGIIRSNISQIYNQIKLYPSLNGGYGLIYEKDNVGLPGETKFSTIKQYKYNSQSSIYSALGSDKVFLLSHNSSIPGKGKINFDDTLYGISQDKFNTEIEPKTSSMVRGEELLELINLIVRFLVTHTHAYPGLPPIGVTQDGTTSAQILSELQNAINKILNTNIRIN